MNAAEHDHDVAEVAGVLRKHAHDIDSDATFPHEGMRALRDSGLLGLLVPQEYGGSGCKLACLLDIAQELGGACVSTALIWAMHCQQVDAIVRHGRPALLHEVLPQIAAGKIYLASITTEQATGGHLLTAREPVRAHASPEDRLLVRRDAPIVTGGADADGFLITMRAGEDAAPHEVSLIYASRQMLDIEVVGDWNPLGMRGSYSPGLRLAGQVPADYVVGEPGGFRNVALDSMIPLAHLGWSACWLGGARGLFREIVSAIRSKSFTPDLGSDLVRDRMARIRMDLELVSVYLSQVCGEITSARADLRLPDAPFEQIHLNVLKVAAAELTFRAADRMMQLTGLFRGYSRNSPMPVERVFRDLRSASLNYSNDRLLTATGSLVPMDLQVRLLS